MANDNTIRESVAEIEQDIEAIEVDIKSATDSTVVTMSNLDKVLEVGGTVLKITAASIVILTIASLVSRIFK